MELHFGIKKLSLPDFLFRLPVHEVTFFHWAAESDLTEVLARG